VYAEKVSGGVYPSLTMSAWADIPVLTTKISFLDTVLLAEEEPGTISFLDTLLRAEEELGREISHYQDLLS
jgi:hypothetical protein